MTEPTFGTEMEPPHTAATNPIVTDEPQDRNDTSDQEQLVFLQPTPIQIDELEEQDQDQELQPNNDKHYLDDTTNGGDNLKPSEEGTNTELPKSPRLPPRQPLPSVMENDSNNTGDTPSSNKSLPPLPARSPEINKDKSLPQLPPRENADPLVNEHMILHRLDETIKELKLSEKYVLNDAKTDEVDDDSIWNEIIINPEYIIKTKYNIIEQKLVSEEGIPNELRKQIWQAITFRGLHHWDRIYEPLLSKKLDQDEDVIKSTLTQFNDKSDTIFNIVKGYLNLDPEIKYSEDILNILIPIFDTTGQDEKLTFSLLISIMKEYNMREFYLKDEFYDISQILYQFDRILESKNFEIYNHFMMQGVKSNMFISDWIRTLLSKIIDSEDDKLRLIDLIYFLGIEVMLIIIIDLIIANKTKIMSLINDDLLYFLKNLKGMCPVRVRESDVDHGDDTDHSTASEINSSENIKLFIITSLQNNTVTPMELMKYSKEFTEIYSGENALKQEMQRIRSENNRLQKDVKKLEHDYTFLNMEHITIANESLQNKLKIQETNDLNVKLQMDIIELKKKLKTLQDDNKLSSNNVNDIPNELQAQLDKTIKKNGEVMQKNLVLQDQITRNENVISELKKANERKEYLELMFKDNSKLGWAGIKKFSISKW